jgi:fructose-bisphosphate aldolase class I
MENFNRHTEEKMKSDGLNAIAAAMTANDKGLLAMDESNPTCNKRFEKAGIPQTEEARRAYREMIITAPHLGERRYAFY